MRVTIGRLFKDWKPVFSHYAGPGRVQGLSIAGDDIWALVGPTPLSSSVCNWNSGSFHDEKIPSSPFRNLWWSQVVVQAPGQVFLLSNREFALSTLVVTFPFSS